MAVTSTFISFSLKSFLPKYSVLLVLVVFATNLPQNQGNEIDDLKKQLVQSLNSTDRGARASASAQVNISILIGQLELSNPNPVVNQALSVVNGTWVLVYTTFIPLFPLLATGTLPLVTVGAITETINSQTMLSTQSLELTEPFNFSVSANAIFQLDDTNRITLKFEEINIQTSQVAGLVVLQMKIPISSIKLEIQFLLSYLDEDLRISRRDDGSVFLFIKQGSSLLTT